MWRSTPLASTAAPPAVQEIPIAADKASALFVNLAFDSDRASPFSATSCGWFVTQKEISPTVSLIPRDLCFAQAYVFNLLNPASRLPQFALDGFVPSNSPTEFQSDFHNDSSLKTSMTFCPRTRTRETSHPCSRPTNKQPMLRNIE